MVREHSHQFKLAGAHYGESIVTRQLVQARLADSAMWLHAWACTLSKLDRDLRGHDHAINGNGKADTRFERDRAAGIYFMEMAESEAKACLRGLFDNDDASAVAAAQAALAHSDTLPNEWFIIHEASPSAKGTGRQPQNDAIPQFPGGSAARGLRSTTRKRAEPGKRVSRKKK
jgi:hypothetical protein